MTAFISSTASREYANNFQAPAIHYEGNEQWVYEFTPPPQSYNALYSLQVEAGNLQDATLSARYETLIRRELNTPQAQWVTHGQVPREFIRRAYRVQYNPQTQQTTVVETRENARFNPFLANGASLNAVDLSLTPGDITLGSETIGATVRNFFLAFSCLGIQSDHRFLRTTAPTCPEPTTKTAVIEGDLKKVYFTKDGLQGSLNSSKGNDDAWVDFDGDGAIDYCAHYYGISSKDLGLQCYLQRNNGHSFVNVKLDNNINDYGWSDSRWWVDVDGDGKADYCRLIDFNTKIRCSFSNGVNFDEEVTTQSLDAGYTNYRWWADVNGDKRADYCRLTYDIGEYKVRCILSLGRKFTRGDYVIRDAPPASADYGDFSSIQWVDVNFDGVADFCRGVGSPSWKLRCNLGKGFEAKDTDPDYFSAIGYWDAPRYTSKFDLPQHRSATWADVDGNGVLDYCMQMLDGQLKCVMLEKSGGALSYRANIENWGALSLGSLNYSRLLDIDGDGRWDICTTNEATFSCALSTGTAFGKSTQLDNQSVIGSGGFGDKSKALEKNPRTRAIDFCRIATQGNAVCLNVSAARQKR